MRSKTAVPRADRSSPSAFAWEGDRDAALDEARSRGCALALWFKLAQAREKSRRDFAAWLADLHAWSEAHFGKTAAKSR